MPQRPLPSADLTQITKRLIPIAAQLNGARVLVAGGTGFVGSWLVESLLHLDWQLGLGVRLVVMTRDPGAFAARAPHTTSDPRVEVHQGVLDGLDLLQGIDGVTHLIHAASSVNRQMTPEDALLAIKTLDQGTEGLLQVARRWPLKRCLYVSSAAVYDRPAKDAAFMGDAPGWPPNPGPNSAYAIGKRMAELRTCLHASISGYTAVIARLGAFIGPLLPWDGGFAAGNFLADASAGRRVKILGDGTAVRGYQYAGDMAVWLWTLLLCGEAEQAYNVGSDTQVSLRELAEMINQVACGPGVEVMETADSSRPLDIYFPPVNKVMDRFGLVNEINLEDAIRRTIRWSTGHTEPG